VRTDDELIDRNEHSLVVQLTFVVKKQDTLALMGSDIDYEAWEKIIGISTAHKNSARLAWDIFKLSHHCSYKALSEEKGCSPSDPLGQIYGLN